MGKYADSMRESKQTQIEDATAAWVLARRDDILGADWYQMNDGNTYNPDYFQHVLIDDIRKELESDGDFEFKYESGEDQWSKGWYIRLKKE